MYLLSTGKSTVLSSFADLETKYSYAHANGESTDFQFNGQYRVFVELNRPAGLEDKRKSSLEVMRIKHKHEQEYEIQRVRKLNIENVESIGCAKTSISDFAVGQTNGNVRLFDYKNAQKMHTFVPSENKSGSTAGSVLFVDYNCTDEYIASVLENGHTNLYGIKTKARLDTLNIDGMSTLARFHPKKRFQLSIASHKGAVTVYDIQTKRKLFHMSDAHDAPCRDLAMCSGNPDILLSVGFDCKVNIYDVARRVQTPTKIVCNYPLSTVALSDCGTFFCLGNLKGELCTYDMRSTKVCLHSAKVHDGIVNRVAFVPKSENSRGNGSSFNSNATSDATTPTTGLVRSISTKIEEALSCSDIEVVPSPARHESLANSITARARDSFSDFLDIQGTTAFERANNRRESFDWETLTRKPGDEKRSSIYPGCFSVDKGNSPNNADLHVLSPIAAVDSNSSIQLDVSYVNVRPRNFNIETQSKLNHIQEEQHNASSRDSSPSASCHDDFITPNNKQSQHRVLFDIDTPIMDAGTESNISAAASKATVTSKDNFSEIPDGAAKLKDVSDVDLSAKQADAVAADAASVECNANMREEFARLSKEMQDRFLCLQYEVQSLTEFSRIDLRTQAVELHRKEQKASDDIYSALAMILERDEVIRENVLLRRENRALQKENERLRLKCGENP